MSGGKTGTNCIDEVITIDEQHVPTGESSTQVVERRKDRHFVIETDESDQVQATPTCRKRVRAEDESFKDAEAEVVTLGEEEESVPLKKRRKVGIGKSKDTKVQYEELLRNNKHILNELSMIIREQEGIPITPKKDGQSHVPITPKFRMTKRINTAGGEVEFEAKVKPEISFFRSFIPPTDLGIDSLDWIGEGLTDGLTIDELLPTGDVPWSSVRHLWNQVMTKIDGIMNETLSLFPDSIIITYISNR